MGNDNGNTSAGHLVMRMIAGVDSLFYIKVHAYLFMSRYVHKSSLLYSSYIQLVFFLNTICSLTPLQKDGSGRIGLQDFKDLICSLKHWQTVFRDHAPEKVGVLRIERFRDALRDVGFVIPERALALLVFKYMRKDGMVRFGDFVSAVVFLHRAFRKYLHRLLLFYDIDRQFCGILPHYTPINLFSLT